MTDAWLQMIECRAFRTSAGIVNPTHDGYVPQKPTSEQIRREAQKLRETSIELIERAKTLIEESAELEEQVSYLNRDTAKQSRKP